MASAVGPLRRWKSTGGGGETESALCNISITACQVGLQPFLAFIVPLSGQVVATHSRDFSVHATVHWYPYPRRSINSSSAGLTRGGIFRGVDVYRQGMHHKPAERTPPSEDGQADSALLKGLSRWHKTLVGDSVGRVTESEENYLGYVVRVNEFIWEVCINHVFCASSGSFFALKSTL